MTFYSPFTGPFSPLQVAIPGVLFEEPVNDNVTEIGRNAKRYKKIHVVDIAATDTNTTSIEAADATLTDITSTGTSTLAHVVCDDITSTDTSTLADVTCDDIKATTAEITTITSTGTSTLGNVVCDDVKAATAELTAITSTGASTLGTVVCDDVKAATGSITELTDDNVYVAQRVVIHHNAAVADPDVFNTAIYCDPAAGCIATRNYLGDVNFIIQSDGVVPMAAALNMGAHEITGVSGIRTGSNILIGETSAPSTSDFCITIGKETTNDGLGNIMVGGASLVAPGQDTITCVGHSITANVSEATLYGAFTSATENGYRSVVVGVHSSTDAESANVIGHSTANAVTNTLVVGPAAITNVRPAGVLCDLGTATNPFKDVYYSGVLIPIVL